MELLSLPAEPCCHTGLPWAGMAPAVDPRPSAPGAAAGPLCHPEPAATTGVVQGRWQDHAALMWRLAALSAEERKKCPHYVLRRRRSTAPPRSSAGNTTEKNQVHCTDSLLRSSSTSPGMASQSHQRARSVPGRGKILA